MLRAAPARPAARSSSHNNRIASWVRGDATTVTNLGHGYGYGPQPHVLQTAPEQETVVGGEAGCRQRLEHDVDKESGCDRTRLQPRRCR